MNDTTDTRERNKQLLQRIFAALAEGDGRPFVDAMADDFTWVMPGAGTWSGRWQGKQAVREQLLKPLFARFETTYRNHALRFTADEDRVVVECRGDVTLKSGRPYCNNYCLVYRVADGRLKEVTEYMDTELAAQALGAP